MITIRKVLSFQQLFMLFLLCIPSIQSLTTNLSYKNNHSFAYHENLTSFTILRCIKTSLITLNKWKQKRKMYLAEEDQWISHKTGRKLKEVKETQQFLQTSMTYNSRTISSFESPRSYFKIRSESALEVVILPLQLLPPA